MLHLKKNIQIFIEYVTYLFKSNKYDERESLILDAQKILPDDPLSLIGTLNAEHSNNSYELFLKRLEIAHEKFPANLQILRSLGSIYLDLKEYDKANKCFSDVNHLESNFFAEMNKFMAHVNELINSEEYTKAETLIFDAQNKWPEKISPFHMHQRLLEKKRRNSE